MTFTFYWEWPEAHLGLVDPKRRTKPHQKWVGRGSGCCLCSPTMLGDVSSWRKFGTRPEIQQANTSHMCESVSTLHLIIASPPTTLPQLTHANHSQTASAPGRCPSRGPHYSCCCSCTCLPGTGSPESIGTVSV